MDNYLNVLKDSLVKKERILIDSQEKSELQGELVKAEEVDWDSFSNLVDEKAKLVEEILKLDEGFESLFNRVKENLANNKDAYKDIIGEIQTLVKSVTEKGAKLEATEYRNKAAIEAAFANTRKEIRQSKLGQKAAADYYNKMNKINTIDPQMLDKNC